jgi:hypothetical protein
VGERYLISGAQIGMLRCGKKIASKTLDEIEEKQFIGYSYNELSHDVGVFMNFNLEQPCRVCKHTNLEHFPPEFRETVSKAKKVRK